WKSIRRLWRRQLAAPADINLQPIKKIQVEPQSQSGIARRADGRFDFVARQPSIIGAHQQLVKIGEHFAAATRPLVIAERAAASAFVLRINGSIVLFELV